MKEQGVNFLLVNSTNEYLDEYSELRENSRYKLTGFSGSSGDALVTPDSIYLFVDGRYHIQADLEVNHDVVTVVKLQTGQSFLDEMIKLVPKNETLGLFSKKNPQKRVEYIEKSLKIKLIDNDPFDEKIEYDSSNIVNVDGISPDEKIKNIKKTILVTSDEEVSYLFNLRDFSKNYSSKVNAKAVISNGKAEIIKDLQSFIKTCNEDIYADKSSINAYDYKLVGEKAKNLDQNPIKLMKSIKTDAEIEHYKEAFSKTDKALKAVRDYIYTTDNISEYDIAQKLEYEFRRYGAKNLSFKSIVAKDKNSALAHYSKCSENEIIKDGSLVLIDCGAYYEQGLATDITRVFVKGEPSKLHRQVYTIVLKMFLNAYNSEEKIGYDIDSLARKIYEENRIEGFEFNHGLGHGIGINVHEYPPNLSKNEIAKVKIQDGMCFTIEPGLYNENHFGVRLENSCYMKDNKIHSFVKMNYEKKLIDYSLLNKQEKEWLNEFEVL